MNNLISDNDLNIWAEYLINYSLNGVTKDDIVMIKGEKICWPLISALQDKVISEGAIPDINLTPPDNDRGKVWGASMGKHGSLQRIEQVPQWQFNRYKNMTKYVEVLGAEDPELFKGQNDELAKAIMKEDEEIKNIRLSKPWVITLFPTEGFSKMEGLSLEEYTKTIVSASTVDPKILEEVEEDIYQLMDRSSSIRIETEHPIEKRQLALQMSLSDHSVIKCTGKRNFPDGEVYTSPDANSVNGEIFVDLPVFQGGTTIQGIYLNFENGIITKYSAQQGNETLAKIIETDAGSHRLGEVALGMNNGIERVLKHPLFVEKVGGTLHIAIGASYESCFEGKEKSVEEYLAEGIMNKSAQHVDIVTDFHPGGVGKAVYLDDVKLEQKNNIWVIPK